MRVAIYYTPPADHPLARAGADWLGRSPFREAPAATEVAERTGLVTEPRRYGFHATLKAPFRLADGRELDELVAALGDFCGAREPPQLGPLRLAELDHFLALIPDGPRPALDAFAADLVRHFDYFRAPLRPHEMARRLNSPLNPRQQEHLRNWGYPYVLDEFRFHMTLTGRVPGPSRPTVISLLQERFNGLLGTTPELDCLAVFIEPDDDADFDVHKEIRFGGRTETP